MFYSIYNQRVTTIIALALALGACATQPQPEKGPVNYQIYQPAQGSVETTPATLWVLGYPKMPVQQAIRVIIKDDGTVILQGE